MKVAMKPKVGSKIHRKKHPKISLGCTRKMLSFRFLQKRTTIIVVKDRRKATPHVTVKEHAASGRHLGFDRVDGSLV